MNGATPDEYFDRMWASGDDPWAHGTRWYETRKYDLTIAALRRPRYATAFEPGCGAGFLTQRLAARCDRLFATERAERGVAATQQRCAEWPHVDVTIGRLPADWPAEPLDLVVLSEVLYYLDDAGLDAVLHRCRGTFAVAVVRSSPSTTSERCLSTSAPATKSTSGSEPPWDRPSSRTSRPSCCSRSSPIRRATDHISKRGSRADADRGTRGPKG